MPTHPRSLMAVLAVAIAVTGAGICYSGHGVAAAARNTPADGLRILGGDKATAFATDMGTQSNLRDGDACTNEPDSGGWLTTAGAWVVDSSNGCKVRLEGVNWYGMQTYYYVPAGLDLASYQETLSAIKALGFNSIRIPLSDELVRDNMSITIGSKWIKKSPELQGLHPLELLDVIVAQAQADGLWVILDNHDSAAVTKAQIYSDQKTASPVWTAKGYSQANWISDWTQLAQRYSGGHLCGTYGPAAASCTNAPTVVGFDLRNEPHTGKGPWNMPDYLKYGSVWGPCTPTLCGKYYKTWMSEKPSLQKWSNWPDAATAAANAILNVNPNLLTIVEGTQLYPQVSAKHPKAVDSYWWGSILKGVATYPINLSTPAFNQQLVYSPHEWGPWKFDSPQFYEGKGNYNQLVALFKSQWAFILHMKNPHPIWLGEFNTCNLIPKRSKMSKLVPKITKLSQCVTDTRKNSQGLWFKNLIQFLQKNPMISWSYYPFNPVNSLDEGSNNSITYKSGAVDMLINNDLKTIEGPPTQ